MLQVKILGLQPWVALLKQRWCIAEGYACVWHNLDTLCLQML